MLRCCLIAACLVSASAPTYARDTLVVAPREFHAVLGEWRKHREDQGRTIAFVDPPHTGRDLRGLIQRAAAGGDLRYVVLVGDATGDREASVPMGAAPAVVSSLYSGEVSIATDNALVDFDRDNAPDLVVGRIPCRTADDLARYVARVIAAEQSTTGESPEGISVVASPGRFSPLVDKMIEFTAQQTLRKLVPDEVAIEAIYNCPGSSCFPTQPFRQAVLEGLGRRSLAWIYMGHGFPTGLDRVEPRPDAPLILGCADFSRDAHGQRGPLVAALLACETGRVDAGEECLAESLLLCPSGPLAVIASSRVCMPYGNSVLGIELLGRLFDRPQCIGDCVKDGKRAALAKPSADSLRHSVRQVGLGASPNPDQLEQEVVEHVHMYNLLGDPLLRLP